MQVKNIGTSRGLVVVNEILAEIIPFLQRKNIRVIVLKNPVLDMEALLLQRIFITSNPKEFVNFVAELEIGLIVTTEIRRRGPEELVAIISDAVKNHELWSRPKPWYLALQANGQHRFETFPG